MVKFEIWVDWSFNSNRYSWKHVSAWHLASKRSCKNIKTTVCLEACTKTKQQPHSLFRNTDCSIFAVDILSLLLWRAIKDLLKTFSWMFICWFFLNKFISSGVDTFISQIIKITLNPISHNQALHLVAIHRLDWDHLCEILHFKTLSDLNNLWNLLTINLA